MQPSVWPTAFRWRELASNLLGTDIVLLLLRHAAGDAKTTAVQLNAAIALATLCGSAPRCLLSPTTHTTHTADRIVESSEGAVTGYKKYHNDKYMYTTNVITTNHPTTVF